MTDERYYELKREIADVKHGFLMFRTIAILVFIYALLGAGLIVKELAERS